MHGLGIYHQHSRSDRENYVEILWQNINKEDWYNFNMYDNRTVNSHGVPYDFMSTMQYSEYDLSNNTKMTIRTLDENAQRVTSWTESKGFWRGSRLPRLTDIELLRKMYKCEELDLSKEKKLPEDGMPTGAWPLLGVQELECKYFKGNAAIPQSHVWINYFERFRKKVWKNCQKLCRPPVAGKVLAHCSHSQNDIWDIKIPVKYSQSYIWDIEIPVKYIVQRKYFFSKAR